MGKLKALIALLILGGAIYVGWNMIPPYFNNQQFQDDLDEIARRSSYATRTDEEILKMVVEKAANYDIKLNDKQVVVSRTVNGLAISVKYRVHVDMILHPVDLDFTANSLNKRL
jgi:hypothetical protein